MIIVVRRDSFGPLSFGPLEASAVDLRLRDAVEELGQARYKGRHHLAGPPVWLEELAALPGLSDAARQGWRDAARWSVRNLARARDVHPRVEVSRPGSSPGELPVFHMGWESLLRNEALQPGQLRGENSEDARYLKTMAIAWLAHALEQGRRRPELESPPIEESRVELSIEALGGDTGPTFVNAALAAGRMLLAVVDSDRGWPGAPIGKTTTAGKMGQRLCRWREDAADEGPFDLRVLPARDIENLLPADLVRELGGQRGLPTVAAVETNLRAGLFARADGLDEALRYIDLGDGVLCEEHFVGDAVGEAGAYRREALHRIQAARSAHGLPPRHTDCKAGCRATAPRNAPPDCAILCALNKRLLSEVTSAAETRMKRDGPGALAALLPFGQDTELTELARHIGLWGLAPRPFYEARLHPGAPSAPAQAAREGAGTRQEVVPDRK